MARFLWLPFVLLLIAFPATAWGPATHAYVASCVTEGQNLSVIFGAMLPDCNATIRHDAQEAYQLNRLTHQEFDLLAASALATGLKTHNALWGADYYAHLIYTPNPEEIFSVVKIRQLSNEFGISISQAEDVIEMCVDIQLRLTFGPAFGQMIAYAGQASGAAHEQALVDAFAVELSARVSGLTPEQAEQDIRTAVQAFKTLTIAFGEQLQLSDAEIHAAIPPILAMYLNCDVSSAEAYYQRGLEITADYMDELNRICAAIKLEMPDAYEGEEPWEGEGEDEGEGEPVVVVVDFCDAFQQLVDNPLLQGLDPEFAAFVELLNPATADLNGTFNVDSSGGALSMTVTGNGILDAANELGLLACILNHPEPFRSGIRSTVLSREQALAAWQVNLAQLNADIGPLASLVSTLVPGLRQVLAGYITLGDGTFTLTSAPTPEEPDAPILVEGSGSFGLVAALFATLNNMIAQELGSGFANPHLKIEDYVTLPMLLAEGDADGDVFTNREEYMFFTPGTCTSTGKIHKGNDSATAYPVAALNYRICPDCETYCGDCSTPHGGLYAVGQDACLRVPGSFPPGTPFDWAKQGAGPLFGQRYEGVDCQTLRIFNLVEGDSGIYICTYGLHAGTFSIAITVGEQLPVGTAVWHYGFLFTALCCLGGWIARRGASGRKLH